MTTELGMAPSGAHPAHIAAGQGRFVQNKWHLLRTIEDIREPLGLKGTSITLLRAMISFLRVDQIDATCDDAHICFASNAALAKRAHVSVPTIERHVAKLVSIGLLTRRSSGNGKRWARRDRHGNVMIATGLSLLPLAKRYAEFVQMSQAYRERSDKASRLRDLCAIALAKLTPHHGNDTLLTKARNLLRRKPDVAALTGLLDQITAQLPSVTEENADNLRVTDTINEGHKDTNSNQSVEKEDQPAINVSREQMERAYPRLCTELRFAQSQEGCLRLMDKIAHQMNLSQVWTTIKDKGPTLSFMILGYLLERVDNIHNHRGYAMKLIQDFDQQKINWRTLLQRPKPSPIGPLYVKI